MWTIVLPCVDAARDILKAEVELQSNFMDQIHKAPTGGIGRSPGFFVAGGADQEEMSTRTGVM